MGYIRVCDLCGKPLEEVGREYKIKKRWYGWSCDSGWDTIEAHDACVERLLNAVNDQRETEEKNHYMKEHYEVKGNGLYLTCRTKEGK